MHALFMLSKSYHEQCMGATVGHETLINLNLSKLRMVKFNMNKKTCQKFWSAKLKQRH